MTPGRLAAGSNGSGTPGIDETVLRRLVADLGADDVVAVCDVFLADVQELLDVLRTAYARGDAQGVARSAHRLKSASGFLGAEGVRRAAAEVERVAGEGRLDGVDGLVRIVDEELERLSHELVAAVRRLPRQTPVVAE